jgi:antitoxin component of MazEF toxin-antitoxin module
MVRIELGTRKIQHIHGSAFVSLPVAWIRTHRLRKGDRVRIDVMDDGKLRMSPMNEGDGAQ